MTSRPRGRWHLPGCIKAVVRGMTSKARLLLQAKAPDSPHSGILPAQPSKVQWLLIHSSMDAARVLVAQVQEVAPMELPPKTVSGLGLSEGGGRGAA